MCDGVAFPLNWEIDKPSPALFDRLTPVHHVELGEVSAEDWYDRVYPQASTQWDGLGHVRHPRHGFYNGFPASWTVGAGGPRLGVEHWARRGIAGRFVLADVAAHRTARGEPIDCGTRVPVGASEIADVLAAEGVDPRPGDVLLVRLGWVDWYDRLTDAERVGYAREGFASPGLAQGEGVARWLWDTGFAAVATDTPALEATPFDVGDPDGFLHYRLIALLGFAVGEMFSLGRLAAHCAERHRFSGLLVSAPTHAVGGVATQANAVALV